MTLNEKFRNVTGLSLDVEEMIANCPVEKKEKLYNDLDWHIGLLYSTCCAEGKFLSDGSDRAETLKEIYNLLISLPISSTEEIDKTFNELVPGMHKSISISEDIKLDNALSISNGCSATMNVPVGVVIDASKATSQCAFNVNGHLEVDCEGEIKANTGTGNGSRIFFTKHDGELKIDSGKFTSNLCVNNVGGKTVINGGEFNSVESSVLFLNSNNETPTEVVINGGKFTSLDNGVIMGNGTKTTGAPCKLKINGGVFNCNIKSAGYIACGIYNPNYDEIEIDGATFNVTDGCCICSRAGKVTIKNSVINMKYTDKALEAGKVGDSRVVIPCVPFVFDESAAYPGLSDDAQIIIGENVTINVEGEYMYSNKKAALITGTKTAYETKFDDEIDSRIIGL